MKSRKLLGIAVLICAIGALFVCNFSTFAASGTAQTPEISYTIGTAYKYTQGDANITVLKHGTQSPKGSTAIAEKASSNSILLGTTASTTSTSKNAKLVYVPVAVKVTVPANTSFSVKHTIAAAAKRVVANKNAEAVATAGVYYLGKTNKSSSVTFYPYHSTNQTSGTDTRELKMAYQGETTSTTKSFSLNTSKTLTYENNTNSAVTVTDYFGVLLSIQYASTYNNTAQATFTFDVGAVTHIHNLTSGNGCSCGLDYLIFESENDFILLANTSAPSWDGTMEYSTDMKTWTVWTTQGISSSGGKLYLRGTGNTSVSAKTPQDTFKLSGTDIYCSGNIEALLDWETVAAGEHPKMADYAFANLFKGNTSLLSAPRLPAETLTKNCYYYMFKDCTSLKEAPELPAKTLAEYCYSNMFYNCTSLEEAPELPAKTLAKYCYYYMFKGCTSLKTAPELPAETLADSCYNAMFYGCTGLETAPALPAKTLAVICYDYMFADCTSLKKAPELPAETMADCCYANMFRNCTSLKEAPALPAETLAEDCYLGMFYGCTGLETAPELPAKTLAEKCYTLMFSGCTNLKEAPELPAKTLAASCYSSMFQRCTSLEAAPALPAETIAENCYNSMFYNCTNLKTVPELPAKITRESCYAYMFQMCTSLETAPALPAETLEESCYKSMFYGCNKLKTAPHLPAKTLAANCYEYMFNGCDSLEAAPELPAETLAANCYAYMFNGCGKITEIPLLPAKTLANNCYESMFSRTGIKLSDSKNWEYRKEWKLPATETTATNWNTNMFSNTSGTFTGSPELNTVYYLAMPYIKIEDAAVTGSGTSYTCTFSMTAPEAVSGSFYIALYDDENMLVGMDNVDISSLTAYTETGKQIKTTGNATKYKIMFWENLETLVPLCEEKSGNITL